MGLRKRGSNQDDISEVIKATYYDSGDGDPTERPTFLKVGLIQIETKFALVIYMDQIGCLQFCDPYTL